jgi:hypothetical protein
VGTWQCHFLAVVGLALVALLFVADATLTPGPPPIVTSERSGLPKPWRPDTIQTLTSTPAPAPDMASPSVLAAQPKSEPAALHRIGSAARAARAEAPRNNRFNSNDYQQNFFDRFSIKGQ